MTRAQKWLMSFASPLVLAGVLSSCDDGLSNTATRTPVPDAPIPGVTTKPDQPTMTLVEAVQSGDLEQVRSNMYWKRALINEPDAQGRTPLYRACELRAFRAVDLLLRGGADPRLRADVEPGWCVAVAIANDDGNSVRELFSRYPGMNEAEFVEAAMCAIDNRNENMLLMLYRLGPTGIDYDNLPLPSEDEIARIMSEPAPETAPADAPPPDQGDE